VSGRGVRRRACLSRLALREGLPSAGANRRNWLVGKQSTISNHNTSRSISIPGKWSSCLGAFHRVGSLPSPLQQGAHLGRLLGAGQIRSAVLRLLRDCCNTPIVRSTHNLFSCNDFSRSVRNTALTRRRSERKIAPRSGTSKRSPLCKSPNGPVAGLSPEILESAV